MYNVASYIMSRRRRCQAIFDTGLNEALDLLQLVELSATARLDPSLRGERRRRDEQQPASGRGFTRRQRCANDRFYESVAFGLQALARSRAVSSSVLSVISCRFLRIPSP